MFAHRRPSRLAALDVGVASPDAARAGEDACEAMRGDKADRYAAHRAELEAEGVTYRPLVWSTYGRPHPETTELLAALAASASRRLGVGDGRALLQRTRGAVALQLRRRAACMVHACLPRLGNEEAEALL